MEYGDIIQKTNIAKYTHQYLLGGLVAWAYDTIKCALLTSNLGSYCSNVFATFQQYEVSGDGYTAGGITLNNCTLSVVKETNSNSDEYVYSRYLCDSATWEDAITVSDVAFAVIYAEKSIYPTPTTRIDNPVLFLYKLTEAQDVAGESFVLPFDATNGHILFAEAV